MILAPIVSVVIPTCDRAGLLEAALRSLTEQTLPRDAYEVVVVDDGSVDATFEVCQSLSSELQLKYFRLEKSGISAAKNLGIFASTGVITCFFDDDDIADAALLEEHVRAHQKHPEEYVAVLGYTTWAPALQVTEVMYYATEVAQTLFSTPALRDGQMLGFTRFWGGRSSCKRSLLTRHGLFDQSLPGQEDLELGYRLSRHGLKVLFHRSAVSYANRGMTYDDFCRRWVKLGVCRWLLYRLHPDPGMFEILDLEDAVSRWRDVKDVLEEQVRRVRELEVMVETTEDEEERVLIRGELYPLYKETFRAFYLQGTIEAMQGQELTPLPSGVAS